MRSDGSSVWCIGDLCVRDDRIGVRIGVCRVCRLAEAGCKVIVYVVTDEDRNVLGVFREDVAADHMARRYMMPSECERTERGTGAWSWSYGYRDGDDRSRCCERYVERYQVQ